MLACSNNPNLCEVSWMSIVSFSLPRATLDHKCVRHLDPPFSSAQCAFFCPKNKLLSICVVRIILLQYFNLFYFSSTSILLLAIKVYAAWSRAMVHFTYPSVVKNKLIVVLCAAKPLSFSSGCPHGTLPTHALPFSLWSEMHTLPLSLWSEWVILSVNSHGDVIGRHEKPTSLYFLTGESHVSEYADIVGCISLSTL